MRLAIGKIRVSGPIEKPLKSRLSGSCFAQISRRPQRNVFYILILAASCICSFCRAQPTNAPAAQNESAARARRLYWEADARYKKEPNNIEAAWQFGRACFDAADFSTNSTERAQIAEQGIAACKRALSQNMNLAVAHYYLGMKIGELAQTRGLSALKLVDQMEKEFELARTMDEQLDYAGADRNLGLLYRDAPSWISVGSKSKARKHLLRAVELAPAYPENHLNLAEAYLKWTDHNGARRELKALEDLWPKARTNLVGAAWSSSWVDWEQRLKQLKKKVE